MNVANGFTHLRVNIILLFGQMLKALTVLLTLSVPVGHISTKLSNTSLSRPIKYIGLPFSPHVEITPYLYNINDLPRSYNMGSLSKLQEISYWDWMQPRYTLCLQPLRKFSRKYRLEQDQYIVITRPEHVYSKYIVRYRYPTILYKNNNLVYQHGRCVDIYVHEGNNTLVNFMCAENDTWFSKDINVILLEIHYEYIVVLLDNMMDSNGYCPFNFN